ncbi:MAG: hypothetical protein WC521_08275 [Bdellovibrionales bacterium]|jgi:hypothetical protein
MKFLALIVFCAFAFQASLAQAAVCDPNTVPKPTCVNQQCDADKKGVSLMDGNKQNIIACICTTAACNAADWKWRSMTTNKLTCPAGQALTGVSNGQPQCAAVGLLNKNCPAGQYATKVTSGVMACAAPPSCSSCCPSCPAPSACGTFHVCGTPSSPGSYFGGCFSPHPTYGQLMQVGGGGPSGCL